MLQLLTISFAASNLHHDFSLVFLACAVQCSAVQGKQVVVPVAIS